MPIIAYGFIFFIIHSSASFLVQAVILAQFETFAFTCSRRRIGDSMTYRLSVFGHRLAMCVDEGFYG